MSERYDSSYDSYWALVLSSTPDFPGPCVLKSQSKRELHILVRQAKWRRRNKAKTQRGLRGLTFYAGE